MKTISSGLKLHLAQSVTTLAICWKITRQFDGAIYAFTTFDTDLVISGTTYKSTVGFSRSSIQTGSTGKVDNLEVIGIFDTGGVVEQDLKNGLFDYAQVQLFLVNWANLAQGVLALRAGWLGECSRSPSGAFIAELRGLTEALVQEFGNIYQPICRADLGDNQCKIPIHPAPWKPLAVYQAGDFVQAVTQTSDALLIAIFKATAAGNSGATEPTWDTTIGANTTDTNGTNPVVWVSAPYWRGIATVSAPIDQHNFISSGLTVPADTVTGSTTAVIGFSNNVSAGTTLTISDGINETVWTTEFDRSGSVGTSSAIALVLAQIQTAIATGQLNMVAVEGPLATIYLQNNSGAQGNITKTGDKLDAIIIANFGTNLLDGGGITWISGLNTGRTIEMKTYDMGTSRVTLWLQANYAIQTGDRFYYYPGCDKRRDTCTLRFNNILNFRGEPDMAGEDALLSYPQIAN